MTHDANATPAPATTAAEPAGPEIPYAGIVTRTVAIVIDAATLAVVFSFLTGALGLVLSLFSDIDTTDTPAVVGALTSWAVLVTAYFTLCWALGGQTLGMRMMGLRVRGARRDRPPGLLRAWLRFIVLSATAAFILPLALVLIHPRRRAVHDLAAGTVVVYTDEDSSG